MSGLHLGLAAIGGKGWMGGANYVRNLAAAVRAVAPEVPITWLRGRSLGPEWDGVQPQVPIRFPGRVERWLDLQPGRFRRARAAAGCNFVYPLTYDNFYNLGLQFPLAQALEGCGWAGWIPDFQHRHLPEFFSAEEIAWRDRQMQKLAEEAPVVVLSSHTAQADFCAFYPEFAQKAEVLRFRVEPEEAPSLAAASQWPARFFLVCNQFWKHKNHQVVFEALRVLRARGVEPVVLCTGALSDYRGDEYVEGLQRLLREGQLETQVQLLGLVSRAELAELMRRSLAVIQPSFFEGWSTVVEDARSYGRPCLLSDLPVHREQNPPGAELFDPHSAEMLAELMERAWREWPAGPDAAREAAAYAEGVQQHREFGREVLALAERQRALR